MDLFDPEGCIREFAPHDPVYFVGRHCFLGWYGVGVSVIYVL